MLVEASEVIHASPEAVWAALARWEDQAAWMRDAASVRVLTEQREGAGVRLAVRTRVLNVPLFTEELEVTMWDPPRCMVIAHRSFIRGTGTWALAAVGDRTRFTWTERVSLPVPVLGEIALMIYRPVLRRLMRTALADLGVRLRGGSGSIGSQAGESGEPG
jgi:hypothetical protein